MKGKERPITILVMKKMYIFLYGGSVPVGRSSNFVD